MTGIRGVKLQTRRKLIWGWFRLFIGTAQVALAAASLTLLLRIGPRMATGLFFAAAMLAFTISRLVFRGQ